MAKKTKPRKAKKASAGRGSERAFLRDYDPRAFEPLAVTVDVALVAAFDGGLHTLVLKRREHPFKGQWALPGGFVRADEPLHAAARRVLSDKTGLGDLLVEQLYTFGAPKRDPRMRILTVAYFALLDRARFGAIDRAAGNAALAKLLIPWQGETGGAVAVVDDDDESLPLAFDHSDILGMVVKRMRGRLNYSPIGFQLLPGAFTLRQLQRVHETVSGRSLNKDSFRRRMLASGQLEATGERQADVDHRPAELYRMLKRSAV